jgi:hypothetical protein
MDKLAEDYEAVRSGNVSPNVGAAAANVAGKLIKAAATKHEYNKFHGNSSKIKFLED